ncbi:hypothetical protein N7474_005615 [Penicillium riverlandense]|uniref:uncharacterized protein n=1 Tax=Penicillium riverlandense TaxID=1903569 RepID=UPI0025479560|nr:uncharacterized protein N7474_005615 [Penicillium riverlandense]KAJ5820024.1 hypothetical protein N7474_005615 [Penicillium riverlandense]
MDPDASAPADPAPAVFNYVLSFLLVGVAWGFTTPFIRRAAADFNARQEKLSRGPGATTDTPRTTSTTTGLEEEQELLARDEGEEEEDEDDRAAALQLGGTSGQSSSARRDRADGHNPNNDTEDSDEHNDEDNTPTPAWKRSSSSSRSWLRTKITTLFWTVINLLRTPAYSIPLVINLTGSIWFFLLVGKHELSLTVPLANSSAFLFTVLGEWYVERKVIARETWLGLFLVLGGIALCVHSKNQTTG